ncbi:hypothetical protein PHSY_000340 [Pseudozyma hubeiensis SY62]|uniref:Uncharacterized protein n=1 Tax=Pseudozyma hubeiensis (strain SY62) TaxID=1305764 RepID=R9NW99_PSEHS|nr:hypothetical protein PHSY_000340 [Pseudozyma hubeiensis SY62]GAC92784.1 hypothetical protein PHSY_000340 [Pseudozyma hubeiensis SY62]
MFESLTLVLECHPAYAKIRIPFPGLDSSVWHAPKARQIIHPAAPRLREGNGALARASSALLEDLRPFEVVSTSDSHLNHSFNIGTQHAAVRVHSNTNESHM